MRPQCIHAGITDLNTFSVNTVYGTLEASAPAMLHSHVCQHALSLQPLVPGVTRGPACQRGICTTPTPSTCDLLHGRPAAPQKQSVARQTRDTLLQLLVAPELASPSAPEGSQEYRDQVGVAMIIPC